ncbi:MAG: methylmalonyl-CoA carboxyltransferase [Deltaproteobacteria bacterium]|nr:methylmalonyl-CoA carboxyltransferase [Deltaproteobacteria bacterium]
MATISEKIQDVKSRQDKIKAQGGEKGVNSQHSKGKLTARERIDHFFDPDTFQEIDMFVKHRCSSFNMQKTSIPADGVITGYGKVNGRTVYVFAQDFTARGGSLGEMHARKITKVQDLAMKAGCPCVGLNDSGGARIQEGIDALFGFGEIFFRNSAASGVIPQITCIMGPTAGGAVYSPAMTDWVFMVKNSSYMYITGPDVIRAVTGEETNHEDLGGAIMHNSKSGCAQFAGEDDKHALDMIKELLSYIPSNNMEDPPFAETGDALDRATAEIAELIPDNENQPYDMKQIIATIVDNGIYLEPYELYAQNIIVCFARLGGNTIGIIANQPGVMGGALDCDASDKATRFIRFCDAFNIPLLTLVDVPGYLPGTDQEFNGIIRHGAKLLWCYSEATVPKMTLITRKAYGGAYIAMCSKHLGADYVFALPSAQIAVMGAGGAANIIHRREIKGADDPKAKRAEKIAEYEELFSNPYIAAERGYVDAILQPEETRKVLINSLDSIKNKRETRPAKKHGNIPV